MGDHQDLSGFFPSLRLTLQLYRDIVCFVILFGTRLRIVTPSCSLIQTGYRRTGCEPPSQFKMSMASLMTKLTHRQYAPLLHRSYAMSHSTLPHRSHFILLRRYVQLQAAHYVNASIRQSCPIRILPSPKLKATMKGKESVSTNNIEDMLSAIQS